MHNLDRRAQPAFRCKSIMLAVALLLLPAVGHAKRISLDPETRVSFPSGDETIYGQVFLPEGAGPFPALVVLHDREGMHTTQRRWAERLVGWGYAAMLVDSLAPRGMKSGRSLGRLKQARDAFAALAYLKGMKAIDPNRIGVIGWSMGGRATLRVLAADDKNPNGPTYLKSDGLFRVGVTYYPSGCLDLLYYSPLLIIVGDKDNLSYALCSSVAEKGKAGGKPVAFVVFKDTTHAFDYGANRATGMVSIVYNPGAEKEAIERVKAFLAEHL